jgi:hypothetical protein
VHPVAASRALLVADAAGMVSPVTAGGTHTALEHGLSAGNAVADFLHGRTEDPSGWFVRSYPKFRVKRLLRVLFDHFQSGLVFNWLLATSPMRAAASRPRVFFGSWPIYPPIGSIFGGSRFAHDTELLRCIDTIFLNEHLREVRHFCGVHCTANSVPNTGSGR